MRAEQFADALGGKAQGVNGSWRAKCPAHEDSTASLMIKDGHTKLLVKCHAGCTFQAVAQAAKEKFNIDIAGSAEGPSGTSHKIDGKKFVAEYVYTDARWLPIAKKVRYEEPDGKKTMRWYSWNGQKYVSGRNDANMVGVLYRQGDIKGAVSRGIPIHLNEGEKACDWFFNAKIPATCAPDGAGSGKFTREHATHFVGADVVIWADIDPIGEQYAAEAASMLRPFAKSIRIVQSATGGTHDDAYDHFTAGFTLDDAVDRSDLLPQIGHAVTPISAFQQKLPTFLWNPYLPEGKAILLDADGGTGKTTFMLAVAASMGLGVIPGEHEGSCDPISTLYYGDEDDPGEYRVIYDACGGDPSKLAICSQRFPLNDKGLQDVEDTIRQGGYKIVVFDALLYYLFNVVKDSNTALEVAPVLGRLTEIAKSTGSTVVCIRHTVKATKDVAAKNLGQGSAQFRNSARGQLVMRWHPDSVANKGVRVVTHEKGSILVEQGQPFAWKRMGYGVEWIGNIPDPWEQGAWNAPTQKPKTQDQTEKRVKAGAKALLDKFSGMAVKGYDVTNLLDGLGLSKYRGQILEEANAVESNGFVVFNTGPNAVDDPFLDAE